LGLLIGGPPQFTAEFEFNPTVKNENNAVFFPNIRKIKIPPIIAPQSIQFLNIYPVFDPMLRYQNIPLLRDCIQVNNAPVLIY